MSFDGNRTIRERRSRQGQRKKILDKIRFFKVITIIFSLYGYDGLGLGFPRERKKRLVSSLSTRLQAKVASFLRVRPKFSKKMKKFTQSRKEVASLTAILWAKRRNGYEKAIQDNNNRHTEH